MEKKNKLGTFEEFLKDYTSWTPADKIKPETVEHAKEHYENLRLREIEQNYFEPYDQGLDQYKSLLRDFLKLNLNAENEIILLIVPSFKAEYGFRITRSKIVKHFLSESLWDRYYSKESFDSIQLNISETFIENEIGVLLFLLLKKAFDTAKTPIAKIYTLDGTRYILSQKIGDKTISIVKASSDEDSWTYLVLDLIFKLAEGSKLEPKDFKILLEYKH